MRANATLQLTLQFSLIIIKLIHGILDVISHRSLPSYISSFAFTLLASLLVHPSQIQSAEERPNVVIILTDDQGWADIGYNNPKVYSPNLDALANSGAKFVNHYVMPQCTPTRVALLTGRYPSRFGGAALSASNQPAFPKGTPTIASMFRQRGYRTYLCGKWHLGSSKDHGPNHFGFMHSYGSLTGAVGMYDHRYRKGNFEMTWHRDHELIDGLENGVHTTDLITNEAIKIIEARHEKPFLLYLPFHAVHTPLDERGQFAGQPTQIAPDNSKRWLNEEKIRWFNDPTGIIQLESDPEKRLLLAAVHHLDDAVGRIRKAIEKSGQRENTLILFSSDNGPQGNWNGNAYPDDLKLTDFNQPLPMKGKKLDVWEGGIHVPGFANWPGKINASEVDEAIHIVDWFPTLANLIDFQPESDYRWDGVDLSGILWGSTKLPSRDLYWNWHPKTDRWAIRSGQWKIVKYGLGAPTTADQWKLFDLANDTKERNEFGKDHSKILIEMHNKFLAHRAKDAVKKKP